MKNVNFTFLNVSFLAFIFTLTSIASFYANAVGLSAYRIYLDTEKRESSFVVYNKDVTSQQCSLSLRHYSFDEEGNMSKLEESVIPDHSAKNWVRFSPQKFTLTPANAQTVRFVLRRKANVTPDEYRSYLKIDCGVDNKINNESTDTSQSNVIVQPKLVHNVPIIVRTGSLEAQVSISDIKAENGAVKFMLNRSGTRSVNGDVAVINKNTGDKVSFQTGVSIYTESNRKAISLGLGESELDDLVIRFTENTTFGGSIEIEHPINSQ